ncbi:MAG: molybdenum cofactor biosynthesis protein MoaE [Verrucomicrobiae bacterium]|nr:molybdenum cofactor biosynthesis protein MoaE [Verrucomicrobiae bacterium]
MDRTVTLTPDPIPVLPRAASDRWGAVVRFSGVVRATEAGAPIRGLAYEAFEAMAIHQFHRLLDELEARWPGVGSVQLVHRLGFVAAGEPSLWIEVAAPHRGEAFAACQWLIDSMKQVVPIWKRPQPAASPNG